MARKNGNVKWFSNEKGYGFIEQEDGEDVFVHHSDIQGDGYKTLKQGETVEYEIIKADKGPKAQNVVRGEDAGGGNGTGEAETAGERREAASGRNGGGASGESGAPSAGTGREETKADSSLASQLRKKLSERFLGGD